MHTPKWVKEAKKDRRTCPKCGRPIAKKYWKEAKRRGCCFDCEYVNKGLDDLHTAGGSAQEDNKDFHEILDEEG